jgi:enoyl-CoA hydratase
MGHLNEGAAPSAGAEGGSPTYEVSPAGIATIALQRPRHMNRLQEEDLLLLQRFFETAAADRSLRALVLTGSGKVFSAGFDLGALVQSPQAAASGPQLFERTVDALEALPVPTIARLNGSVYGGATDLALACDFRVGVRGMELRMPAARFGLHYYPGGLRRYVQRLGLGPAKRLFLLGETVDDQALLHMGYLDTLVEPEALDDAVGALTSALAANAPLALQGMKCSLNEMAGGAPDLQRIAARVNQCADSDDLAEGLRALTERRTPTFNGR